MTTAKLQTTHPSSDYFLSAESPEQIDAKSQGFRYSLCGKICIRTIGKCVQKEMRMPINGHQLLEKALLADLRIQATLKEKEVKPMLTPQELNVLFYLTQREIHTLTDMCPADIFKQIEENAFDPLALISQNVAHNPSLQSARFLSDLRSVLAWFDLKQESKLELKRGISFLQSVSYKDFHSSYQMNDRERLVLFLLQFTSPERIADILEECSDAKAAQQVLDQIVNKHGQIQLPEANSPLRVFIHHLYETATCYNESLFVCLHGQFKYFITGLQTCPKNTVTDDLLIGCGPLIYGMHYPLQKEKIYRRSCEILGKSPYLPLKQATQILIDKIFRGVSSAATRRMAIILYQGWWCHQQPSLSLADKQILWLMYSLQLWKMQNPNVAVTIVKEWFYEHLPLVPCNVQRIQEVYAELQYFFRQEASKKSL